MRVVHIITMLEIGGAEMMLKKLVLETKSDFEHVVISLHTIGTIGKELGEAGVRVIALEGQRGIPSPSLLIRLVKELHDIKPDIVQGWMYHGNFAASLSRRVMRARWPISWSIRCTISTQNLEKPVTRLIRNVSMYFSGPVKSIIYNSNASREQHEDMGYPAKKGSVIPNGFDTDVFKPNLSARSQFRVRYLVDDAQIIVGHIARVDPMKDQETLLLSASKVLEQNSNVFFVLAGRDVPTLARSGTAGGSVIGALGKKIILLPEEGGVSDLAAAFDIFVLSSAFGEAFPNVLGEALSCGVPCVSTDVGDCAAIIGDAGAVAPVRDPGRLASAILNLLRMPEHERRDLGLTARARMQRDYSLEKVAAMYAAHWRDSEESGKQASRCVA